MIRFKLSNRMKWMQDESQWWRDVTNPGGKK